MKKYLLALLAIPLLIYGCGTTVNNSGSPSSSAQVAFTGKVSQYDYSGVSAQSVKSSSVSTVNTTPLSGATVKIEETLATTVTDAVGKFGFSEVPSGDFTLEVTKEGYIPLHVTANSNSSTNIITSEDFFPFQNGGTWVYKSTDNSNIATVNISYDTVSENTYIKWSWKFYSPNCNPTTYYQVWWLKYDENQKAIDIKYVLNEIDNTNLNLNNNKVGLFENILIKYPLKIGEVINAPSYNYQVIEKINSITIRGVTYQDVFKAKHSHTYDWGEYTFYYYYAKNIGIIKIEDIYTTFELSSCSIN